MSTPHVRVCFSIFVLNCECSRFYSSTANSCYWCSICVWRSPLQLCCGTMHRTMLYAAWPVAVCTMLCGPLHLQVIGFDQIRRGPQAGQAPAKWPQLCCLVLISRVQLCPEHWDRDVVRIVVRCLRGTSDLIEMPTSSIVHSLLPAPCCLGSGAKHYVWQSC